MRPRSSFVYAVLLASMVASALAGPVAAAAPQAPAATIDPGPSQPQPEPTDGPPAITPLVGSAQRGAPAPAQLGLTAAQVKAKEDAFATWLAEGASGVSPMVGSSGSLPGWVEWHQKTNYWCVVATLQSIAHYRWGDHYVTPSVYSWQYYLFTSGNGNVGIGTSDSAGFVWVNGQIKAQEPSSTFYYAYAKDTSAPNFESRGVSDIGVWGFPLYVAVNVQSTYYAWHQNLPATHATAAVAYGNNGAQLSIGDPFTSPSYAPYCATGVSNPGYSSTPDTGCIYGYYDGTNYFRAMVYEYW